MVAARAAVARLDDGPMAASAALALLDGLVHVTGAEKLTDTYLVASVNRFEEQLKVGAVRPNVTLKPRPFS